jgi:L-ribulose-5-phosphate 3-epimerase
LPNEEKYRTQPLPAVPIDEGFVDYRAFLAALDAGGFAGTVAYEMCSPLLGGGSADNLDWYARKFVAYIQELQTGTAGPNA